MGYNSRRVGAGLLLHRDADQADQADQAMHGAHTCTRACTQRHMHTGYVGVNHATALV